MGGFFVKFRLILSIECFIGQNLAETLCSRRVAGVCKNGKNQYDSARY